MQTTIIGRTEETEILRTALVSEQPEFIALVGRRRVGKTFLVKHIYQHRINFELTGLQHTSKSEQLQNFVFAIRNFFPDFDITKKPKNWLDAFFMLSKALDEQDKQDKMVVFLDELPWLGTKRSGFLTGLSWFWNSWAINQHLVLVVCGSAASWMIDKVVNDKGGLHNRITGLISLYPFTLGETETFLNAKHIFLNKYQITQLYLTMGGIPMYLNQIRPHLSAVQNIQAICFKRNGYLRNEFDRLFASLFDNYEKHIQLIRALASKKIGMTRQQIIDKTKFQNGGMLTKWLNELHQSGFIEIYAGYGKKKRLSLYRLADPYSLFYLTFIEPLGVNAKTDFTKLSDLPNYKAWSGYAFENICLAHIDQIRKALGISGIFTTISSFIAKPTDGLSGAQIDLIIDRSDHSINLCEIKFSQSDYKVTKKDVTNLENKKQVFQYHTKTKKHIFVSLITTYGVVNNAHRLNHINQVVTLANLFE